MLTTWGMSPCHLAVIYLSLVWVIQIDHLEYVVTVSPSSDLPATTAEFSHVDHLKHVTASPSSDLPATS